MFHAYEQPLRHLAKNYGKIVGARGFSGPTGKLLDSCESLAIVNFGQIANFNLDTEPSDLSEDQMYLYEFCCCVSSGIGQRV